MGRWKLRYFLTDDSAAEQRAVAIAFPGLTAGEQEVDQLLCRKRSERTMDRKLAGARNKAAKGHLYQALYFRHSAIGCEQSIEAAIHAAPEDKKEYMVVNTPSMGILYSSTLMFTIAVHDYKRR